ncbi:hypothetical protein BDW68DRAFT_183453 [Aspergillus falconensis]
MGSSESRPPVLTRCHIPPGEMMVSNFTINQPGTDWYHSQTKGQYPDGRRQALLIRDADDPYIG